MDMRTKSTSFDLEKEPPALAAYIERIGAERRNFRRYVIKREGRDPYHYDAAIISIVDGKIRCDDPEYAPTDDERNAIEKEITSANWPKSVAARDTYDLHEILKSKGYARPELFEFRSEDGDGVLFVQQRIRQDDGGKADLPWSYWSDKEWRQMEPDGPLPLYGLEQLKDACTVFIHEGAKAAHAIRRPGFLKDHPWADDLDNLGTAHLGWPGGAPNPHRVDWEPIRRLSPHARVTIVCDNDKGGEEAAPKISRIIQRKCGAILFDKMFPAHFDLADPFPKDMWEAREERRVFVGPSFQSCWTPATWATRKDGKHFELREEFASEWISVVQPNVFIHQGYVDRIFAEPEFNKKVRPFSDVKDPASLLQKSFNSQAAGLVYEPGKPSGLITMEGIGRAANVYRPSSIKGRVFKKDEDKPWHEFMKHLLPDKAERDFAYRWCATLIAKTHRMRFGMLLISETQGVGKSTLGEKILAPLVGWHNTSAPSESDIVDADFDYWTPYKRLAVVQEIYSGHSVKAYNKLKSKITDDTINVKQKFVADFKINNHINVFACSNSIKALKLDQSDRRWFIPHVTEETWPHEKWVEFNRWLSDGGLVIITQWAHDYVETVGFVKDGEHPMLTSRKREVARAGLSDGERFVAELGDQLRDRSEHEDEEKRNVLMRLDHVRVWLGNKKAAFNSKYRDDAYLETAETIASVLRGCGLKSPEKRFKKDKFQFRVIANFEIDPSATWKDLEQFCCDPSTVDGWKDDQL